MTTPVVSEAFLERCKPRPVCSLRACKEVAVAWGMDDALEPVQHKVIIGLCEHHLKLGKRRFPNWRFYDDQTDARSACRKWYLEHDDSIKEFAKTKDVFLSSFIKDKFKSDVELDLKGDDNGGC